MDENGLHTEIFETIYFGTTMCSLPYMYSTYLKKPTEYTWDLVKYLRQRKQLIFPVHDNLFLTNYRAPQELVDKCGFVENTAVCKAEEIFLHQSFKILESFFYKKCFGIRKKKMFLFL